MEQVTRKKWKRGSLKACLKETIRQNPKFKNSGVAEIK